MRPEAGQLTHDYRDVFHDIVPAAGVRDVHEMNQQARALDMTQELRAQTGAGVRAFNEARNIGHNKTDSLSRVTDGDYAKVRLEPGERIIGNLRARRRNTRDQGGFANIGVAHEPDVSEQLQFQSIGVLFTRPASFMLARRLVNRGCEACVSASAASAAGDDESLIRRGELEGFLAAPIVVNDRADRHL